MRLNPDDKTVAAMDLLVPRVGELIGGSQREERLQVGCALLFGAQHCCHSTIASIAVPHFLLTALHCEIC